MLLSQDETVVSPRWPARGVPGADIDVTEDFLASVTAHAVEVPEPSSIGIFGSTLAIFDWLRRRRQNRRLTAALGSPNDHIDPPAPALAAHKSRMPIRDGHLGAVALGHLGGVGLDLMAAIETPHDQPHPGRSGVCRASSVGRCSPSWFTFVR